MFAENSTTAPEDREALLQLLSQAEIDEDQHALSSDRLAILEKRLSAGPLTSSHIGVMQLLRKAEVCQNMKISMNTTKTNRIS